MEKRITYQLIITDNLDSKEAINKVQIISDDFSKGYLLEITEFIVEPDGEQHERSTFVDIPNPTMDLHDINYYSQKIFKEKEYYVDFFSISQRSLPDF